MMRIGCQNHSVEAWKNFTDEEIKSMDSDALEFWSKYKTMLLVACDTHVHAKEIGAWYEYKIKRSQRRTQGIHCWVC